MLRVKNPLVLLLGWAAVGALAWEDPFDGRALAARWQWRVPAAGPTMSLTDRPGWLRVTLPDRPGGYNHWNEPKPVDEAPQLRTAAPEGDWELETHIHLQQASGEDSFLVGLVMGTSDDSLLTIGSFQYSGMATPPEVWFEPTGTSGLFRLPVDARDVRLRLVRKGNLYWGQVSQDGKTWMEAGCCIMGQAPRFVGIIGKTFSSGPPVVFDVDYFRFIPSPALEPAGRRTLIGIGGDYPTGYRGLLSRLGLPHEVLLDFQLADPKVLRRFDLLLIGSLSGGIDNQAREALASYVRDGGIAVLDSRAFPPATTMPGKGDRAQDLPDIVIDGPLNPLLPWLGETTRFAPGESRFHFALSSTAGCQVLARFGDPPNPKEKPKATPIAKGTPAIWAMPVGRGLLVYSSPSIGASLSWGPTHDRLAVALIQCLGGDRVRPQLVEEGVRFGRKQSGLTAATKAAEPTTAQPPTFERVRLSVPTDGLSPDQAQIKAKTAPEFNLSGSYRPGRGAAELVLNHWSRRYLVSIAFAGTSVRLARTENGKVVATAETRLDSGEEIPFLVKERRDRIVLAAGSHRAEIRADGLWQGALAVSGNAIGGIRYQPVEPAFLNDDFMRGEREQGAWEVIAGKWSVRATGDPKMGANPFTYQGQQDHGVGLVTTGLPFWDDYVFEVSAKPTSDTGALGLAFHCRDGKSYLLFRLRTNKSAGQGEKGAELLRIEDGQETVLAQGNTCLVAGQWYRLAVRVRDGVVTACVDGREIVEAEDGQLPTGRIGLSVQDGGAEFDDVAVRPADRADSAALVELDGSVPRFAGTMDRDTWAGTALQWRADPLVPGRFWRRGAFFGDFDLAFACNFGEDAAPSAAFAFLLAPQEGSADEGYGVVLRRAQANGARGSYEVELTRNGSSMRRGTVSAGPEPVLAFRRTGLHLSVLVDGHEVLECPLAGFPAPLARLGFRAEGFLPRLSGLRLHADDVLDYCFDRAPTDWWVGSGTWELAVRWPCTPEWSWLAGESREIAALWHKRQFMGDQTLDLHVGPRTVDHGDKRPREICRAFNVVICGDGQSVKSGYSFVVGADKNGGGATFYRNGKVVAREPGYRIYSDAHNQWINVRAEKQGATVRLWVGDQRLFSWLDPDPLPGGRLAVWTEDNSVMVPRVTIYHGQPAAAAVAD